MNRFRFSTIARSIAVAAVILWALSGPLFGFSDTWQLDTQAIQIKLDESHPRDAGRAQRAARS